jgi:hypothetical protein
MWFIRSGSSHRIDDHTVASLAAVGIDTRVERCAAHLIAAADQNTTSGNQSIDRRDNTLLLTDSQSAADRRPR